MRQRTAAGNDGAAGETASVTVVADNTPPSAPSGVALVAGDGEATLTWTDPVDADLDSIYVYGGTTSGALADSAHVGAGVETYTFTGLTNGVTFYGAVTAADTSANESATSTEVSGTPAGAAAADLVTNRLFHASLRRLSAVDTDRVLYVRRSSDNLARSVAYDATGLVSLSSQVDADNNGTFDDATTLGTWVGGGSAYVQNFYPRPYGTTVFYGNTTAAQQPRLVNAGVLETDAAGNVAFYCDGTDDKLAATSTIVAGATPNDIYVSSSIDAGAESEERTVLGTYGSGWRHLIGTKAGSYVIHNSASTGGELSGGTAASGRHVFAARFDATSTLHVDGTGVISGSAGTLDMSFAPNLCSLGTSKYWKGHVNEVLIFDGVSSDQAAITSDITTWSPVE